ncbi:hypothetical protein [Halobaculum gomorrense]|uniref:Uncharacterized protein n=1 Tax=Halobaculum gomorrense TaxID=43928 RepID=A0A1M5JZ88_9EURY|nr:hypothetical protein [Halobaculum gomorrense]SHG45343.1 hypothetical protein SAMN05443636_0304 [Halobaculum gomorrense]
MSTTPAVDPPERVEVETSTRARIDVTETSVHEVESFLRRNDCRVHFERRGGTTDLVVVADR